MTDDEACAVCGQHPESRMHLVQPRDKGGHAWVQRTPELVERVLLAINAVHVTTGRRDPEAEARAAIAAMEEAAPTVPDAEKREPPYTSAQISDPRLHAYYESAHYPDSHRCYWCGGERSHHEFESAPVGYTAGRESRDAEVKRLRDALEEIAREGLWIDGDRAAIQQVARAALSEQETPR